MTADLGASRPLPSPSAPSARARIYGLGSIFAKTMRDSRRAVIVVAAVLGLLLLAVSAAIVAEFATPASRVEIANLVAAVPPIMQGLAGQPVNVETLGGYLSYKYGTFFPIIVSLWSILALSGTLAMEAQRGSLEFVASTAISRRRIALQKVGGHVVALTIACAIVFLSLAIVGTSVATLPGDEITVAMAGGYALWLGLLALAAGALAFAIAPFFGRGAAVGIAGSVMFAGFILSGYQTAIPGLAPFAKLTWWGWTYDHIPLAGQFDWPSLALVAVVAVALLSVGVTAFVRRDLGATSALPMPSLPRALVGLRGPTSRAAAEMLPSTISWGLGLGLFGLVLAASGKSFVDQLGESPAFMELLSTVFPGADIASAGGFLQLVFVEFGLVLAGLAAATLVARWASDETSGRLEMVLATPLARARWVVSGGVAALVAIGVIVVMTGLGILVGASFTGGDLATPVIGSLVLGIYAAGLAGIGVAVGGLVRTGIAGPLVAIVAIVMWFVHIIGPALSLPDVIQSLALPSHFGQPMLGVWDPVGIVASAVLAISGVILGAWGFRRRDLRG